MGEALRLDAEAVMGFCERQGLYAEIDDSGTRVSIPRTEGSDYVLRMVFYPERGIATAAYLVPGDLPRERIGEFAMAANLLNARTFMGAWVVNDETGELYFRQTVHTDGTTFDDDAIRNLLQVVVGTVEATLHAWTRVAEGAGPAAVLEDEPGLL